MPPRVATAIAPDATGPDVSVEHFLKQRAVKIIVGGSYTLPNWYDPRGKPRTFACRTTRVSPFRMMVEVPVVGKVGDRLTSYLDRKSTHLNSSHLARSRMPSSA